MNHVRRISFESLFWAAAIVSLLVCAHAWASSVSTEVCRVETRVGIGQSPNSPVWKPGRWTKMEIRLESLGNQKSFSGTARVTMPDPDGTPVVFEAPLEGEIPCRAEVVVRFGHASGRHSVELEDSQGRIVWAQRDLTSGDPTGEPRRVVGVVGESPAYTQQALEFVRLPGKLRPCVVHLKSASELPDDVRAWEIFDSILITTADRSALDSWSDRKIALLETWVRRGGRVVLSVGVNAPLLAKNPRWSPFFPGEFTKMVSINQASAIEKFAKSALPIPMIGVMDEYNIDVAQCSHLGSQVEILAKQYEDLPLVTRSALDFGVTTFVAFDLDAKAIAQWKESAALSASLLNFSDMSEHYRQTQSAGMHYGYDDMSGQLRSALDDFDGLRNVSFPLLILFFALYVVAIGPGCYYACRKLPFGEVVSWSLFLLFVAVGTCGLFLFAKGRSEELRMNRIFVTDFRQETGLVRQNAWGNFWSPWTGKYDVRLSQNKGIFAAAEESATNPTTESTAWFGLPGAFLGGMESRIATASVSGGNADEVYRLGERVDALPMRAYSTRCLTATRWGHVEPVEFGRLRDVDGLPFGTIQNPLDQRLEKCLLIYGGWAYELGALQPGEVVDVDERLRRYDVASVLIDEELVEDTSLDKKKKHYRRVNLPYDRTSHDLEYIMKTMLFYASAGGRSYTGLENRYQFWTDATSVLQTRTAVLYGVLAENQKSAWSFDFLITPHSSEASAESAESAEGREPAERVLKNEKDAKIHVIRAFMPVSSSK
ncbi:MAG: hypothetical protein Q4D38_01545 [Planctomycetia bacterium]|nr:hypothetical protein [Planctomycetia bacterium]